MICDSLFTRGPQGPGRTSWSTRRARHSWRVSGEGYQAGRDRSPIRARVGLSFPPTPAGRSWNPGPCISPLGKVIFVRLDASGTGIGAVRERPRRGSRPHSGLTSSRPTRNEIGERSARLWKSAGRCSWSRSTETFDLKKLTSRLTSFLHSRGAIGQQTEDSPAPRSFLSLGEVRRTGYRGNRQMAICRDSSPTRQRNSKGPRRAPETKR